VPRFGGDNFSTLRVNFSKTGLGYTSGHPAAIPKIPSARSPNISDLFHFMGPLTF
jgi:hypothetical protein